MFQCSLQRTPRTDVFASVTEPWRLSSLSTGAAPKKSTGAALPIFFTEAYGYTKAKHLYWHLLSKGITGATTIDHIFSTSTHT